MALIKAKYRGLDSAAHNLVLLESVTLNDVASVTIGSSSLFTSTYKTYMVQGSNIHFGTDEKDGRAQFSIGGSLVTANYSRSRIRMKNDAATVSGDSNNQNAGSMDNFFGFSVGNASGEAANFTAFLYDPAGTDNYKHAYSIASYTENNGGMGMQYTTYSINNTGAIDGLKLFLSSGNLTSGFINLYGMKN